MLELKQGKQEFKHNGAIFLVNYDTDCLYQRLERDTVDEDGLKAKEPYWAFTGGSVAEFLRQVEEAQASLSLGEVAAQADGDKGLAPLTEEEALAAVVAAQKAKFKAHAKDK